MGPDDGVRHVISLPEPAEVLTAPALGSFARLVADRGAERLGLDIDDRLASLSDAGFGRPRRLLVERAPAMLLDGDVSTLEGLDAALAGIDPRWWSTCWSPSTPSSRASTPDRSRRTVARVWCSGWPNSLMLLDSASLHFRAFYGMKDTVYAPDGHAGQRRARFSTRSRGWSPTTGPRAWSAAGTDDWRPEFRVAAIPSCKAPRRRRDCQREVPDEIPAIARDRRRWRRSASRVASASGYEGRRRESAPRAPSPVPSTSSRAIATCSNSSTRAAYASSTPPKRRRPGPTS